MAGGRPAAAAPAAAAPAGAASSGEAASGEEEPKLLSPAPWMRQHVLQKARMASIHDEEIRALCCSFVCNGALLMWQQRLPHFQASFRNFYPWLFLLLGVAQYEWHVQHPASYLKFRPYVRALNRLVRAGVIMKLPFAARPFIHTHVLPGGALQRFNAASANLLPPTAQAVKHLGVFTGALMLLAHAVHTTFRPGVQAAVQGALVAFLLVYQCGPAAAVLRVSGYAGELRGVCTALNTVILLSHADVENYASASRWLDGLCRDSAEEALAVFATLYLGLVVPVWLALRLEARHRHFLMKELLLLLTAESLEAASEGAAPAAGAGGAAGGGGRRGGTLRMRSLRWWRRGCCWAARG